MVAEVVVAASALEKRVVEGEAVAGLVEASWEVADAAVWKAATVVREEERAE